MIAAVFLTALAVVLQLFFWPPLLGIPLQLSVITLVWLAPWLKPSEAAGLALFSGLLTSLLLPGPTIGVALAFTVFAGILYVAEQARQAQRSFSRSSQVAASLSLVMIGSLLVAGLANWGLPIGYFGRAAAGAILSMLLSVAVMVILMSLHGRRGQHA